LLVTERFASRSDLWRTKPQEGRHSCWLPHHRCRACSMWERKEVGALSHALQARCSLRWMSQAARKVGTAQ